MNWLARYIATDRLWSVGYYYPNGDWASCHECDSFEECAAMIHFLNGGPNKPQ